MFILLRCATPVARECAPTGCIRGPSDSTCGPRSRSAVHALGFNLHISKEIMQISFLIHYDETCPKKMPLQLCRHLLTIDRSATVALAFGRKEMLSVFGPHNRLAAKRSDNPTSGASCSLQTGHSTKSKRNRHLDVLEVSLIEIDKLWK